MKLEPTIYVVDANSYNVLDVSDEDFIELAENYGNVYSLKGYQDAFNDLDFSCDNFYMKIFWRRSEDATYSIEVGNPRWLSLKII